MYHNLFIVLLNLSQVTAHVSGLLVDICNTIYVTEYCILISINSLSYRRQTFLQGFIFLGAEIVLQVKIKEILKFQMRKSKYL